MTALALAGAGGGSVQPDLVLPPGFDRLGDVVRFEQDYREKRPSGELDRGGASPGVDPCEVKGATPSPGTDGRGPASHGGLRASTSDVAERPGRIGLPGAVAHKRGRGRPPKVLDDALADADLIPCARCGLRGHVAGDPDRCLFYRGSLGLGGSAYAAQDQAQWRNNSARRGDH